MPGIISVILFSTLYKPFTPFIKCGPTKGRNTQPNQHFVETHHEFHQPPSFPATLLQNFKALMIESTSQSVHQFRIRNSHYPILEDQYFGPTFEEKGKHKCFTSVVLFYQVHHIYRLLTHNKLMCLRWESNIIQLMKWKSWNNPISLEWQKKKVYYLWMIDVCLILYISFALVTY